jgi:uncharacterized membrane protein SirB2
MIEFYPEIRLVHVAAVIASGALFLMRGIALQLGWRAAMAAPVRYSSYAIDTVLLTAAFMLATILRQYPFVQDWVTAKVLLLVVYIVLGSFALKRGRTRAVRAACFLAALVVYLSIVSIATAHHPLGWLYTVRLFAAP